MKPLGAVLALGLVFVCACRGRATIGMTYPPLPHGYASQAGALIPDTVGGTDYGIDWVRHGDHGDLWFARLIRRDPNGVPLWELRDTMRVPMHQKDERIVFADCSLNGQTDLEILVLVRAEDSESLKAVLTAWRADRRTGRFRSIPAPGVACRNESYGE